MDTHTQILFNSPALHSLKRDQLLKLCKTHGVKASGKNVEIIERLRQHGLQLQKGASSTSTAVPDSNAASTSEASASPPSRASSEPESDNFHLNVNPSYGMPRPSEQWEIVMDTIEELDEASQGTLNSHKSLNRLGAGASGEFGIAGSTGSKSSSSVSSSIKALATSLGLKRGASTKSTGSTGIFPSVPPSTASSPSKTYAIPSASNGPSGELTLTSVPYTSTSAAGPPVTDHFVWGDDGARRESLNAPLPGTVHRPGAPAPSGNVRLSMGTSGQAGSTTVRLVSLTSSSSETTDNTSAAPSAANGLSIWDSPPKLPAFQTTFDLIMGTPGGIPSAWPQAAWPTSPTPAKNLYPALPSDPQPMANVQAEADVDMGMPGGFEGSASPLTALHISSPQSATTANATAYTVDGTAHTRTSVMDLFPPPPSASDTAAPRTPSQSQPFVFGSPAPEHNVSNQQFAQAANIVLAEMNARLGLTGNAAVTTDILNVKKFEGSALQAGPKTSRDKFGYDKAHQEVFEKMEGIAEYTQRRANAGARVGIKRKSDVLGPNRGPAGRRSSTARVISNGTRKKMLPGSFGDDMDDDEPQDENRRMSKRARVSLDQVTRQGTEPCAPAQDDQADPEDELRRQKEREAIRRKLELNRARRRSSRGMPVPRTSIGRVGQPPPVTKGRFGFLGAAKSFVGKVWGTKASTDNSAAQKKAQLPSNAKTVNQPATAPAAEQRKKLFKPAPSTKIGPAPSTDGSVRSSRSSMASRPSTAPSARRSIVGAARQSSAGTAGSRVPGSTGTMTSVKAAFRTSVAGVNSLGARNSSAGNQLTSRPSSLGARSALTRTDSPKIGSSCTSNRVSEVASPNGAEIKRVSRLLAPTASSLAKMQSAVRPSTHASASGSTSRLTGTKQALEPITNAAEPRPPGVIFSKPISMSAAALTSPTTKIPSPVGKSLAHRAEDAGVSNGSENLGPSLVRSPQPRAAGPIRKPRISRSKVIAKLGAQRSTNPPGPSTRPSGGKSSGTRTRSSMGAAVADRKSLGGAGRVSASGADNGVALSAKKKARQSEYARRRSQAAPRATIDATSTEMAIDG
ncbi:hypothetical protein PUNSTDRAFT_140827 [Punctularia strigosozonata HHB-11173 SS5]|uniref:uncharacterized protein n=1 Tax=Punctularia strigosozonata (strain HHB-11173) TaxID=741275 RepID=UPI0004416B12|nr:uncharacterized protein PUNSTDRAFT_140827 [Punctularia strigosozonata HHB-11173 SS5]EIN14566.1 hypothetical protein PUNSTDRAFT_140827 [Punctularia strigosozonata HHB-11173 SS5]